MPSIIVSGADASASLDFALPFDGIEYLNFFDGAAALTRNLGRGQVAPSVVGAPVQGAGFVPLKGQSAFIATGVAETAQMTLISASRAKAETNPIYLGNYGASMLQQGGVSIHSTALTAIRGSATTNNAGAAALVTGVIAAPAAQWSVKALRVTGTQVILDDLTAGLRAVQPMPHPRAPSANPLRVGSGYAAGYAGASDHFAAAIVSRAISDDELGSLFQMIKALAQKVGIAV